MIYDRFLLRLGLAMVGLAASASSGLAQTAGDLEALTRLSKAKTKRVSSFNREQDWDANLDRISLRPGQTVTIAEIQGPAAITHIWMTINAIDPYYSRSMVLRIYWDGEEDPGVESPIGDFFAVGNGMNVPVNSLPVQVSSAGRARNSFWRMPFRRSARVTVSNDSPTHEVRALYFYVDYEELPVLEADTPYFHAQYRQEYPCGKGDYLVLDAVGRGHYVGTVLSVWHSRGLWFGEGDDRFYIDGDERPTLHGTGTEDYFSDAWGFRVFNHPYHGVTVWEAPGAGTRGTAYRWHIVDPIRFDKSLKFEIEHTGPIVDPEGNRLQTYGERSDYYSTVAFWYQTGRAKPFSEIPPVDQRLPPYRVLEVEAMLSDGNVKAPEADLAEERPFRTTSGPSRVVFLNSVADQPWLELGFEIDDGGWYVLHLDMIKALTLGNFRVLLDMKEVRNRLSLYSEVPLKSRVNLGAHQLSAGSHTLRFEYVGSSEGSLDRATGRPGRGLALDRFLIAPIN